VTNYHKKAEQPFYFCTRLNLRELTGFRARNLRELVDIIKIIPGSSIFQHTHIFLQKKKRIMPEHTNDFAYWVASTLGEHQVGEELASIDLLEFSSIRALREKIINVIENNLFERKEPLRMAPKGMDFEFIKSHSFILPTPYVAKNLSQFIKVLKKITVRSIYFHVFEARLRLEKGVNDFSKWIDTSLAYPKIAGRISSLDPYTHTLEGLRKSIVDIIKRGDR